MHSFEFHRGLLTGSRVGAVGLAFLLVCAGGRAQTKNPSSSVDAAAANSFYNQGLDALQRQDLAGARAAFEKTIKLIPRSPEPHNSLGWVLLAQGETDAAIVQFKAAVNLKPDFAQAHMNLSRALLQKGDAQGAVREAREAVRLAPADSETHHILGQALSHAGDAVRCHGGIKESDCDRTESARVT